MGYTTDFIGHVDIEPPLNDVEIEYLIAFSQSRRCRRPGGTYVVPANPRAEDPYGAPDVDSEAVPEGQPGYWCDWEPCWDGCCLSYNGNEKFYGSVSWMRYLIDHFLRPGAHASSSSDPQFEHFTFDHVLDGTVVGCRRDNKELFAIVVERNEVREEVIRRADPRYVDWPPLPYEEAIDRELPPRQRRRRQERRADPIVAGEDSQ